MFSLKFYLSRYSNVPSCSYANIFGPHINMEHTSEAGISHPAILSVQISGDELSHLSQIHHEQYFSTKEILLCRVAGIFWVDTSEWL